MSDLSVKVPRGGITTLLGQNGCGKTTILRSIIKYVKPMKGSAFLGRRNISSIRIDELPKYVSYAPSMIEDSMGFRAIDLVLNARKAGRWVNESEAMHALEGLGMINFAGRMFGHLSTGQKKLVMIARAVAVDAPLMLLDEPTSGLDPTNRQMIAGVIGKLAAGGTSVLIATHDIDLALQSDYIIALKEGKLFASGRPERVLSSKTLTALYNSEIRVYRRGGRMFAVHAI